MRTKILRRAVDSTWVRSWLHILPLAIAWLSLTGCALTGQAMQGRVLEEGTDKPIPDAIVVAQWIGYVSSYVDSSTVCYHVLSTTTDEDGVYRFPEWRKEITEEWQKHLTPEYVTLYAYKPTYGWAQSMMMEQANDMRFEYLKPFSGAREERLMHIEKLKQTTTGCADPKVGGSNLIPLYRALYEEAITLVRSPGERGVADGFLSWIELLEREAGQ